MQCRHRSLAPPRVEEEPERLAHQGQADAALPGRQAHQHPAPVIACLIIAPNGFLHLPSLWRAAVFLRKLFPRRPARRRLRQRPRRPQQGVLTLTHSKQF